MSLKCKYSEEQVNIDIKIYKIPFTSVENTIASNFLNVRAGQEYIWSQHCLVALLDTL